MASAGGSVLAGQVVVGDQHLPAARLRRGDAGVAGDAVVDGDQQVGLQRREFVDQRRRQPVAVHDAVGHRVRDAPRAEHAQAAHADRAGGGAVAIEIADDDDVAVLRDRVGAAAPWPHRARRASRAAADCASRGCACSSVGARRARRRGGAAAAAT